MKAFKYLLIIALFLPLLTSAQTPPASAKIRFLFLDESNGSYSVKIGADHIELGSKPYVFSRPFEFPVGSRLELHKRLPDPKTGETVRTRVANLTVGASPTHALAIVSPSATAAPGATPDYRVNLYDVSPEKTPDRSIRILNLSPSPMAARFGTDQLEVSPGGERIVAPTVDKRSRIRVYVAAQAAGEWNMIFNSFLSLQEKTRMTGIVVYSPSGMRHTYTENELKTLGPPQPGFFWLYFTEQADS
ncbi:MAG: hypothetical protein ABII82_16470 [Verrucomicrobiota bacterium]